MGSILFGDKLKLATAETGRLRVSRVPAATDAQVVDPARR